MRRNALPIADSELLHLIANGVVLQIINTIKKANAMLNFFISMIELTLVIRFQLLIIQRQKKNRILVWNAVFEKSLLKRIRKTASGKCTYAPIKLLS